MKSDLRFTPTTVFPYFPVPWRPFPKEDDGTLTILPVPEEEHLVPIGEAGEALLELRTKLLVEPEANGVPRRGNRWGPTELYNLYDAPNVDAPAIEELRQAHVKLFDAVLRAYAACEDDPEWRELAEQSTRDRWVFEQPWIDRTIRFVPPEPVRRALYRKFGELNERRAALEKELLGTKADAAEAPAKKKPAAKKATKKKVAKKASGPARPKAPPSAPKKKRRTTTAEKRVRAPEPSGAAMALSTLQDTNAALALLRAIVRKEVRADGIAREELAHRLARAAGYKRVSEDAWELADNLIRTAAHRGLVYSEGDQVMVGYRQVSDYDRDKIDKVVLASVPRTWTEREEALRRAANHLGYQKLGPRVRTDLEKVLRRLLKRGSLERDGSYLRRV